MYQWYTFFKNVHKKGDTSPQGIEHKSETLPLKKKISSHKYFGDLCGIVNVNVFPNDVNILQ